MSADFWVLEKQEQKQKNSCACARVRNRVSANLCSIYWQASYPCDCIYGLIENNLHLCYYVIML